MVSEVTTKRISVDEFQRMGEAGVFGPEERLELLDGEIIQMNPIGRRHAAVVNRLTRLFVTLLGERVLVSVQNPLVADPFSQPQPDLVVLQPRDDDYEAGLPTAEDVYLVVEVADSTLTYDRTRKARAYARAGVPALWIVALGSTPPRDRVLLFTDPVENGYRTEGQARRGDEVIVPGVDVRVSVNDFL